MPFLSVGARVGASKRKAQWIPEPESVVRSKLNDNIAINHLIIGDRVKFILFDGLDTS